MQASGSNLDSFDFYYGASERSVQHIDGRFLQVSIPANSDSASSASPPLICLEDEGLPYQNSDGEIAYGSLNVFLNVTLPVLSRRDLNNWINKSILKKLFM